MVRRRIVLENGGKGLGWLGEGVNRYASRYMFDSKFEYAYAGFSSLRFKTSVCRTAIR